MIKTPLSTGLRIMGISVDFKITCFTNTNTVWNGQRAVIAFIFNTIIRGYNTYFIVFTIAIDYYAQYVRSIPPTIHIAPLPWNNRTHHASSHNIIFYIYVFVWAFYTSTCVSRAHIALIAITILNWYYNNNNNTQRSHRIIILHNIM